MLLLILSLLPPLAAFESDQLTRRGEPLRDSLEVANVMASRMLDQAVAATNRRTRCEGADEEVREILAREIRQVVGEPEVVPRRGQQPLMQFGAYAAWLEESPDVDRRVFHARDDLYGTVEPRENLLLAWVGPASTIRLGDVLLGTDKIDHFWVQGYLYYRRSREGTEDDRAVAWGTRTEWTIWGMGTTRIFSFGDLAANYDGYTFYDELLSPGSVVRREATGCAARVRDWDWREWVDAAYDEVLNPSSYGDEIRAVVQAGLLARRDAVCADYATWRHSLPARRPGQEAEPFYTQGPVPQREDPYGLDVLCGYVSEEPLLPFPRERYTGTPSM